MSYSHSDFVKALMDPQAQVPQNLRAPDQSPAGARFDVYRNNVMSSLMDAMKTGFPVVEKLLGAGNFKVLALAYIRQHPPRSPVLMFYGQGFDAFIRDFPPLKDLVYLPDVARLELARREVYHGADDTVFDAARLQAIGQERFMNCKMQLAKTTQIISSAYPLYDIWLRNSGRPEHPVAQSAQTVVLTRPGFDVISTPVSDEIADFLHALQKKTVQTALEQSISQNPAFPFADVLTMILQSGLASAFIEEPTCRE